ncbi:acyltransferase [Chimaeribacter coloradensis]|uniref:Acyltransferase n=1 Tax=Chimaeribacter coloradensis TaxID=2060068 RepID=A0A2N5ED91_9GAMM|nr:acyltransferase [Chimaeribacter coloradensis]PLR40487.1 acyltransferase [Chimaeribacter coloradensis]
MAVNKRFDALDSFRGLCAMSVVVYHVNMVGSVTELSFFRASHLLVDFFFVLSGFVLAHGYGFKSGLRFKDFFISRTFRIFPLHIFMLGVFILLEIAKWLAYKKGFVFNSIPFTGVTAPQEILPNLVLVQSWTPLTNPLSYNFPSWSISVEYYMYMIFFALTMLRGVGKYLAWAAISCSALYMLLHDHHGITENVLRGLSCFFGGCLTYVLYRKVADRIDLSYTAGSLLEMVVLAGTITVVALPVPEKTLTCILLFCLCVFTFSLEVGAVSQAMKRPFFLRMGVLSYSIYMTHAAILFCLLSLMIVLQKVTGWQIAPMVGDKRYLDFGGPVINDLVLLAILALVIFIAGITNRRIEKHWQQVGRSLTQSYALRRAEK